VQLNVAGIPTVPPEATGEFTADDSVPNESTNSERLIARIIQPGLHVISPQVDGDVFKEEISAALPPGNIIIDDCFDPKIKHVVGYDKGVAELLDRAPNAPVIFITREVATILAVRFQNHSIPKGTWMQDWNRTALERGQSVIMIYHRYHDSSPWRKSCSTFTQVKAPRSRWRRLNIRFYVEFVNNGDGEQFAFEVKWELARWGMGMAGLRI
jgi:hypothetical protein